MKTKDGVSGAGLDLEVVGGRWREERVRLVVREDAARVGGKRSRGGAGGGEYKRR